MKPGRLRTAANLARYGARNLVAAAVAAPTWFAILGLTGVGLILFGVNTVFGQGWAAIAGGIFSLIAAWLIGRGMANA